MAVQRRRRKVIDSGAPCQFAQPGVERRGADVEMPTMPNDGGVHDTQVRMFPLDEQGLMQVRWMRELHVREATEKGGGRLGSRPTQASAKKPQGLDQDLGGDNQGAWPFHLLSSGGMVLIVGLEQGEQAAGISYSRSSRIFQ